MPAVSGGSKPAKSAKLVLNENSGLKMIHAKKILQE